MRLMIVDDSNVIRSKIERIQVSSGQFEVVGKAINGQDAVDNLLKWNPEVVTMDLTMPEMDGISCIENLMNIKPDLLILVVSALSDKETGIEALMKGARGFLCKPFSDQDLSEALQTLTDQSQYL